MPIIGGISEAKQQRLLRRGPEIIVATPGRLWDLLEKSGDAGDELLNDEDVDRDANGEDAGSLRRHTFDLRAQLIGIRALVIDECDRMFERAHFKQLTQLLALLNEECVLAFLQVT